MQNDCWFLTWQSGPLQSNQYTIAAKQAEEHPNMGKRNKGSNRRNPFPVLATAPHQSVVGNVFLQGFVHVKIPLIGVSAILAHASAISVPGHWRSGHNRPFWRARRSPSASLAGVLLLLHCCQHSQHTATIFSCFPAPGTFARFGCSAKFKSFTAFLWNFNEDIALKNGIFAFLAADGGNSRCYLLRHFRVCCQGFQLQQVFPRAPHGANGVG